MKKLLFSLALVGAVIPSFAVNSVNWEILRNPVDGESGFPQTASGRQLFVDFNNDGIMDYFIIAGQANPSMGLFKGNADGTYTDVTAESEDLYAKSQASAVFIDIDNDGNLDLITVGKSGSDAFTDIFMNSGAPDYKFVADWDMIEAFPGLSSESNDNGSKLLVAFDYNNDGWTDLLINGSAGGVWEEITGGTGQGRVCAIMKNNHGTFELLKNPVDGTENFIGVNGGSIDVADFNNDGWMDILVTGYHDEYKSITKLYKNNGNDTFTEVTGIDFVGHQQGETAFIDVNNDGYADIIEIGRDVNNGWAAFGKLYINNQDGTFTRHEEAETNFFGGGCALAIGDVNNDGLNDYFMTGWNTNATFMYNNGDNSFTKQELIPDDARCRGAGNTSTRSAMPCTSTCSSCTAAASCAEAPCAVSTADAGSAVMKASSRNTFSAAQIFAKASLSAKRRMRPTLSFSAISGATSWVSTCRWRSARMASSSVPAALAAAREAKSACSRKACRAVPISAAVSPSLERKAGRSSVVCSALCTMRWFRKFLSSLYSSLRAAALLRRP